MNGSTLPLSERYPGGCFIGFNAAIDRRAMEQLVSVCSDAVRNGYDRFTLCLNSIGGELDQAYYGCGVLDALPVKIITHNIGMIQSAANLLFLCGDDRYASDGATFFFHQTYSQASPGQRITEALATERLKSIRYDDNRTAAIISAKTNRPIESVREWQNTELVMDNTTAIEHGIAHSVRQLEIPKDAFFHQVII